MAELIISVSGLRGVIGENLTPELAARFACAYAAGQPGGPLVLARDGRSTGRMLTDAIRGALLAVGRSVLDADVAATPTVGVLVRHIQCGGSDPGVGQPQSAAIQRHQAVLPHGASAVGRGRRAGRRLDSGRQDRLGHLPAHWPGPDA